MYEKKIWMYWENKNGSKKPHYLDLCLETIKRNKGSFEIKLLNENSVGEYIKLPGILNKVPDIAHKADYIRFMLLYEHGGIWLDSDVILLRDIEDAVKRQITDYDYVGYGKEYGKPSMGFMAAKKNSPLLGRHLEKIDSILRKKTLRYLSGRKVSLGWTEIGYDVFWPLSEQYRYYHHDFKMFAPTSWSDREVFRDDNIDLNEYLSHKPFSVMLYNSVMYDSYKDIESNIILNGNSLLSKLFQVALN